MKTRFVAGVTLAIALLLITTASALAHAQLVSSDPAVGATITTPHTLTATYDDELTADGSSIVIQNSAGTTVASGTVSADDAHVMTADLPQLPDGIYNVLWTAVSADDKAIERGTYQFAVGASAGPASPSPTPAPSASGGNDSGGGNDLLLPLAAVIVIVVAVAGFLLYRSRR